MQPTKKRVAGHKPLSPNKHQSSIRTCLWKGPEKDGITSSLLSKFLVCRERFRIKVVEGLKEDIYDPTMEYGSMWHAAEEAYAKTINTPPSSKFLSRGNMLPGRHGSESWLKAMTEYYQQTLIKYPQDAEEITKWYKVCRVQFPIYINHWKSHETELNRKPVFEEKEFRIPYKLPSGRTVILRGKIDCAFRSGPSIYIQENKTKGRVDEEGVGATLFGNLQTMLYHLAVKQSYSVGTGNIKHVQFDLGVGSPILLKVPPGQSYPVLEGVLYNVIRRPLTEFQKHNIRPRKSETDDQFYNRLGKVIEENADYFFLRWKCTINPSDERKYARQVFDPLLQSLVDWWDWINCDPYDPWRTRTLRELRMRLALDKEYETLGAGAKRLIDSMIAATDDQVVHNTVHWQAPWGVYNGMFAGFRGDYYDYLTTGKRSTLIKTDNLFPELTNP